jgi:hypothetical protein
MRTISGLGGDFVVHGVGEGEVDLTAEKRDFPESLRPWRGAVAGDSDVKLVLLRPFVASIFVVDSVKNEPLLSAWVAVKLPEEKKEIRGRTGRDGEMKKKFPFPAARAPDVLVTVSAGTEEYGSVMAEDVPLSRLEEGEGFTLRLAKREPAILRLTILYDTGKPYANWLYFVVEPSFGDSFNRWSRLDGEGLATIKLPPGHYEKIRAMGHGQLVGDPIENLSLDPEEEISRTITVERGGDLTLQVSAGEKGEQARGAMCVIEHAKGTTRRNIWGSHLGFTDLPPGPATVTITLEGYETRTEKVTLVKDEVKKLTLRLRRPPKKK